MERESIEMPLATGNQNDASSIASALTLLESMFPSPFEVHYRKDTAWATRHGAKISNITAEPNQIAELIRVAAETRCSTALEINDHSYLLGAPLIIDEIVEAVAVQQFNADDSQWPLRMARAFDCQWKQTQQIRSLTDENRSFLEEISQSFEELTVIRELAHRVANANGNEKFNALCEDVLAVVLERAQSHQLVFVPAKGTDRTIISVGAPQVSPAEIIAVMDQLAVGIGDPPLLLNDCQSDGTGPSSLHQLTVVPVATQWKLFGWVAAINFRGRNEHFRPSKTADGHEFGTREATVIELTCTILAAQAANLEMLEDKEELLVDIVAAMVAAIDAKDQYTRGHSERVAKYAKRISIQMGYSCEEAERLYLAGLLHDIGKIAIRDATLQKPGRLTEAEFAEIQRHTEEGWTILKNLDPLSFVLPGVLQHHERMDGKGYPDGLSGEEISLDARILSVADAYDAMTSDRAYRQGMSTEGAETILRNGAGNQWDANVVDAFFVTLEDIYEIRETYTPSAKASRVHSHEPTASCQSDVVDRNGALLVWS